MIIAFEGIDGAGKNTLVSAVEAELISRELPVARLGFPRYEDSVHAALVQRALTGQMGDLIDSINGMATLFALDRAEVADELAELSDDGYVVLLDRFVASNAAYSAARMVTDNPDWDGNLAEHPIIDWVDQLEFQEMGSPIPDLHVLVATSVEVANQRAERREETDATRTRDAYESNSDLQMHTLASYHALAQAQWASPWLVVDSEDGGVDKKAAELADHIVSAYEKQLDD